VGKGTGGSEGETVGTQRTHPGVWLKERGSRVEFIACYWKREHIKGWLEAFSMEGGLKPQTVQTQKARHSNETPSRRSSVSWLWKNQHTKNVKINVTMKENNPLQIAINTQKMLRSELKTRRIYLKKAIKSQQAAEKEN
jgi:hypothetical protein